MIVKALKIGIISSTTYILWLLILEFTHWQIDIKRNTILLLIIAITSFWVELKSTKKTSNPWKITSLFQFAVFILIFSYFFAKSAEWILENIFKI